MMFWLLIASVTADKMMDECHPTMVCIAEVGDGWQQSMLVGEHTEHSHHMPA